jgi:hypothetical protein
MVMNLAGQNFMENSSKKFALNLGRAGNEL